MNKIIISMGLAAVGTAALQMNCAAQSSPLEATPKDWNVSAALRGFYDDNYVTSPNRQGSTGVEFSPTASASVPFAQTEIGFLYSYDLQYYQHREDLHQNAYDQSHNFNLWLDHAFNEEWNVKVNDTFVVGQEPELLAGPGAPATYQRLEGNNIANNATVDLHTDWSTQFSTELTYGNYFSQYSQNQPTYNATKTEVVAASYAGELNRDQNSIDLEGQWHFSPETMVTLGYQFQDVNYLGDQSIGYFNTAVYSDSRDNDSHFVYVGAQHNLLPNLVAAAKAGIQYDDYYNHTANDAKNATSPYADVSVIYTYLPGCNAQVGFTQARNSTDYVGINQTTGSETLDQESSSAHASINHHFTPRFLGSVVASWTSSTFNGGQYNNESDDFYAVGLSANYVITRNISAEADYNYSDLSSDIAGRGYDRNRITLGLSVSY